MRFGEGAADGWGPPGMVAVVAAPTRASRAECGEGAVGPPRADSAQGGGQLEAAGPPRQARSGGGREGGPVGLPTRGGGVGLKGEEGRREEKKRFFSFFFFLF
jgi:hypothetical protein